mgnify:CR=1 FL=1
MQTVEEILDVLLACEVAVGEYDPPYGQALREKIAEARSSLLFWVAKDRIAGAREQWKAARERGSIFTREAQDREKEGEKAGA